MFVVEISRVQLSSLLNNGAVFVSYLIRTKYSCIKVWMPVCVIVTTLKQWYVDIYVSTGIGVG